MDHSPICLIDNKVPEYMPCSKGPQVRVLRKTIEPSHRFYYFKICMQNYLISSQNNKNKYQKPKNEQLANLLAKS